MEAARRARVGRERRRIARVFAPLPPLGRGVAALATSVGVVALAGFGLRTLVKGLL